MAAPPARRFASTITTGLPAATRGHSDAAECYYRTLLRATVEVPLDQLKQGANRFQFRAEPQICHGFDWGFYWVYAFTARVYYDGSRAHPTGEILSHEDGGRMGEFPRFVVDARSVESPIQRVDVIANYEDFNWEGDGIFRQWHYIMERGQLKHHVGSAFAAPWAVNWDTEWIPDQDQPVEVAARITDNTGLTYLTPSRKLKFERTGRSVKMYKAKDVPEVFGVRVGRRLSCNIPIDGKLETARNARLVLSTWSAAHDGEISINKKKLVDRIGLVHNYSFDSIPVQAKTLKAGDNTFEIFSNTKEHAPEVNWPGPVLLVEYTPPPMKPGERKWLVPEATHRMEFDVDPAGYDRRGTPVEVELNAKGLAPVRLIDLTSGAAVPFQSEPGRIVFLLPEMREARKFQVYLGKSDTKQAASPFKITDDVEWAGQKSFRIETPSGHLSIPEGRRGIRQPARSAGSRLDHVQDRGRIFGTLPRHSEPRQRIRASRPQGRDRRRFSHRRARSGSRAHLLRASR